MSHGSNGRHTPSSSPSQGWAPSGLTVLKVAAQDRKSQGLLPIHQSAAQSASAQGYRRVHRDAVQLLSPGEGRIWLDAGCGPGLITRLAAGHGYHAHGLDRDPAMIRFARAKGLRGNGCSFAVGDAGGDLPAADVVSAASVLCQAPDPAELLSNLWAAVRPGGSLLLVETTQLLSVERIRRASERDDRRSRQVLGLWARARQGRALPDDVYETVPAASRRLVPLLDGCVQAVVLTRNA